MTEAPTRSYDDHPESDVATVLQVPLQWGGRRTAAGGQVPAGRHRATEPVRAASPSRGWSDHPAVAMLQVGLASALLVLTLFGAVLLALARWMP